ncbi:MULTISPECIES: toll/interleukin-1 receptor domain-containing protein [unclassified Pseudomonas]|uniref:toll/interleukin-1 receptor domain-containing protein n=1 Tax=unclassified Pseudomonas TaxID=196821 RepID=UPI001E356A0D|nr:MULTISPECIES: toll/interleukin-1 receptor domain-containing protein [unclassified Pseudomonas]MDH1692362.1 toll/interleukin-1 receptor domain-containing protein [Pseudomonas sp. GD03766]UFH29554.1 toll/interleukin-1 receptor domain-containing protein [Pseudomonas sp. CIP-10]
MKPTYQLALLGSPSESQIADLAESVGSSVAMFGLKLGHEIGWEVVPEIFEPDQKRSSAAVFFGGVGADHSGLLNLLRRGIPVIPVVSDLTRVSTEIPDVLRPLNCLSYANGGARRIATALLECVGLLPKQRRVFVSYRRDEARQAALQMFDALSARHFDVFLDTHSIAPAEDFQTMLWHRLCDSDVLLMLDTPDYFNSRWTAAEFGRALAKGIGVLRVAWPGAKGSERTKTASLAELAESELDDITGRITECAVDRICLQLEEVRSKSHAVRTVNLVSKLRMGVEDIGGEMLGIGAGRGIRVRLPDGVLIVVYPAVGVPTSMTMHEASMNSPDETVAILYDHIGLHQQWLSHLDWLGQSIQKTRWVKACEAGWELSDWRV